MWDKVGIRGQLNASHLKTHYLSNVFVVCILVVLLMLVSPSLSPEGPGQPREVYTGFLSGWGAGTVSWIYP